MTGHTAETKTNARGARLRAAAAVLLAVMTVCIAAVSFAACNQKGDGTSAGQQRADAIALFESNVLGALDESWRPDMTEGEIITLPRVGSYVEASLWLDLLTEVLDASSLQTAKIRLAAEFAASEDGKRLLADAEHNADAVISFAGAVGFTSDDVSELGFALLRAAVSDTAEIYTTLRTRLQGFIDNNMIVGSGVADIEEAVARADRVISSLGDAETTDNTLAALDEAEEGIGILFGFAYDAWEIFGTGESGSGLAGLIGSASDGSGALAGVSDSELLVWLDGVIGAFADFGTQMTDERIAAVKTALAGVRECFEGFAQPIEIMREALTWLEYAESAIDEVPLAAEYIAAAAGAVYERDGEDNYTYAFIRKLKSFAAEEDAQLKDINAYVLAAGLAVSLMSEVSAEEMKAEIDRIAASGDRNKNMLLYLGAVTFSAVGNGEMVVTDEIASMIVAMLTDVFDEMFAEAYRDYILAPEENEIRLQRMAGSVIQMVGLLNDVIGRHGDVPVEITVGTDGPYDEEWRAEMERIAAEAAEKAADITGAALPSVAADTIKAVVDDFYASAQALAEAAEAEYITDAGSDAALRVMQIAEGNVILALLASLVDSF